jgi:hypothetical protein
MKNKAAAKLPKMAMNASATRKFMALLSIHLAGLKPQTPSEVGL